MHDEAAGYAASRQSALLREIGRSGHWLQLGRFAVVGASGYAINLTVFAAMIAARADYRVAATAAFMVALVNNFAWNRRWTFPGASGSAHAQAVRFLIVSVGAFLLSLVVLDSLIRWGAPKVPAEAAAVITVTPVSFIANKFWSFRQRSG
jgi:dolichol-phosphate mannosyltransferase